MSSSNVPSGAMPSLEELVRIKERVLARLKPFQRETVRHVESLFEQGANRVLVADEVGLGKTLIARGIVATTAVRRKKEGDSLFKVAYICSNGAIANQNLRKLSIDDNLVHRVDASESRLSMQHLIAFENERRAQQTGQYIQLIPLTPGTSFHLTAGGGIVQERVLMYEVLRRHPMFRGCDPQLASFLRGDVSDWTWQYWTEGGGSYGVRIERAGKSYLDGVFAQLSHYEKELGEIRSFALSGSHDGRRRAVGRLRHIFARISASGLDPDLVIMDEFQRFRSLLDQDASTELGMLSERFLMGNNRGDDPVRVLLLSATPFKSYSTAAEDESFFGSESQQDFIKVVDFLSLTDAERQQFETRWGKYGRLLAGIQFGQSIDSEPFVEAKSEAERALRNLIARSERVSFDEYRDAVEEHKTYVDIDERDVASFLMGRRLFSRFGIQQTFSPEYTESCPYLLSFLKGYKLGDKLERAVGRQQGKFTMKRSDNKHARNLWLSTENIRNYRKLDAPNSRFRKFQDEVFETGCADYDASALLWVPASLPYYEVSDGPYAGADGFSKTLVFSSWTMVPRMMSTLLSYEDERRSVEQQYGSRNVPYTYFDEAGAEDAEAAEDARKSRKRTLPSGRLHFLPEARGPVNLLYPSIALASCVDWSRIGLGRTLSEVKGEIRCQIADMLVEADVPTTSRTDGPEDSRWVLKACFQLDAAFGRGGNYVSDLIRSIETAEGASATLRKALAAWRAIDEMGFDELGVRPDDLDDRLAAIALGSPAVCAIRLFGRCSGYDAESDPKPAFRFAYAFTRKMNTPASTLAVDACQFARGRQASHWEAVLEYCIKGNLQSVLDEYGHQLGFDKSAGSLCELMIGEKVSTFRGPSLYTMQSQYEVETLLSFRGKTIDGGYEYPPMRMRAEFAAAFMQDEGGGKNTNRRDNMRCAFNSPFRPFVLVSTSIGQEGLDFHAYCRKIVHWNLPSNPIDLEQREGRINRYESLALRQNIAAQADVQFEAPDDDVWAKLFDGKERQLEEARVCDAGLVPHWGLPSYEDARRIERHVYLRRLGREEARYQNLIDILVRYRAVLGMPRQEELLQVLSSELSLEEIESLFINLCPYVYRDDNDSDA